MTAKTRRLRELLASEEFLYMPSAATPLEGRLAEAAGTPLVYTGGYVSGGTKRNLDWVRPHVDLSGVDEDEALLLADAQTSGGLLVAGELPGYPVIGELLPARGDGTTLLVR